MIRILGGIVIIVASTLIGFIYAERFSSRVKELNEIERCIYQLRNEIIYTHTPLIQALRDISSKTFDTLSLFFNDIASKLENMDCDNVYEAFNDALNIFEQKMYINGNDKIILLNLSKSLGETDIDGQLMVFELAIENLKKQIREAEEIMKKNVKMYRYLGFCIGAMVVIMLI